MLPFSEACERNKVPILAVLKEAFAEVHEVLEIGSGTGQHALYFAQQLPQLTWQPTDRADWLPDLCARLAGASPGNLRSPLELDVRHPAWPVTATDAVFTANTLHIMSWPEVEALFLGLRRVLRDGGLLAIYGPFRYRGDYTSPSNAAFDLMLRERDPASGIRDFELIDEMARDQGLRLEADHSLPANNQLLVFRQLDLPASVR